ncbi:MAG: NB-ARC domain-containing protein, partial [Candidatus Paceibacterota bacterium]
MGDERDENGLFKASDKDYKWIPGPIKKSKFHCINFRRERSYKDALNELLKSLSNTILPLCKLDLVPNKPVNFITRNIEVEKIKEIVMGDNYKPGVITSVGKSTAVQGMGGIGKSVLAASVCHDCDVRRSFSDGVYWITVGNQQPELNIAKAVQKLTGDDEINPSLDVDKAKSKLAETLKQKNCLIVLDDVWKQQDISIFPSDEALRCRLLITTRNKQAVEYLSGIILEVDLLSKQDAQRLLAKAASNNKGEHNVESMPLEAGEIIEECGYLPLAIAMAGGMISGGDNKKWQSVLKQLKEADLTEISKKFPDYPYPNPYRVLDASVKALEVESLEEDATRAMKNAYRKYLKLAIFKEDTVIPKSIIELLWGEESFFNTDTDNLLDILVARSLIQRNKEDNYILHDLQLDYLRKTCTNIKELNKDFLGKLGDPLKLTDKYTWNNYIWHLIEAGEKDDAIKLLTDFSWLYNKLSQTSIGELLKDFDWVNDSLALNDLRRALYQSTRAISQDPSQLAGQLVGRLGSIAESVIIHLLDDAKASRDKPWLQPVYPSLLPPNAALAVILTNHEGTVRSVTFSLDARMLASAGNSGNDQTIRIWDLNTATQTHVFENQAIAGGFTA